MLVAAPNHPGLPSPEEMDGGLYHFIRENNDQGVALRRQCEPDEAIANFEEKCNTSCRISMTPSRIKAAL